MGNRRIYGLLSALLFAAACAYLGAALLAVLQKPRPVLAPAETPGAEARLHGIILRREEALSPAMALEFSGQEARRIPATENRQSGCLLPRSDGYEYLCPEDAFGISPSKLEALLASKPVQGRGSKLVYGFEQYYAAFYEGENLPSPGSCRIKFDGIDEIFPAEILEVSTENGVCALLLRLTAEQSKITFRLIGAELIY